MVRPTVGPRGTQLGFLKGSVQDKLKPWVEQQYVYLRRFLGKDDFEKYEKEGHPYYSSARLWDDGIITPIETRTILIKAFKVVSGISHPDPSFPVFRM